MNHHARDVSRPASVDGPETIALTLRAASPTRARDFAVAMHERCCETGDDERTEFWLLVVERLQPVAGFLSVFGAREEPVTASTCLEEAPAAA